MPPESFASSGKLLPGRGAEATSFSRALSPVSSQMNQEVRRERSIFTIRAKSIDFHQREEQRHGKKSIKPERQRRRKENNPRFFFAIGSTGSGPGGKGWPLMTAWGFLISSRSAMSFPLASATFL